MAPLLLDDCEWRAAAEVDVAEVAAEATGVVGVVLVVVVVDERVLEGSIETDEEVEEIDDEDRVDEGESLDVVVRAVVPGKFVEHSGG